MADVHTVEQRSFNMSRIRSKDTNPELVVRRFLFSEGFRYRIHVKHLPGKPDIVLSRFKTVVLVNGCFWHGHKNCKLFVMPKSNLAYWKPKIEKTILRDRAKKKALVEEGWNVVVIWECELQRERINTTLKNMANEISRCN